MPVYKLLIEMSYDEFSKWLVYFEKRPIDWRSDLRTSYLLGSFGEKRRPYEIFPSLIPIFKSKSNNEINSIKTSLLFNKMLSAKGGDKLDILGEL